MTGPETLDVARDAIWTIVVVSSPLMVVGLVVGVVVSLFQALTQIQEMTLTFVPKIIAIMLSLLLLLPFMLATRAFSAAFLLGLQLSGPFLVFGLVFNIGLGVLARLMPQMQVYFVGVPLSIMVGFLIFALVLTAMMGTYLNYFIGVMHQLTPLR